MRAVRWNLMLVDVHLLLIAEVLERADRAAPTEIRELFFEKFIQWIGAPACFALHRTQSMLDSTDPNPSWAEAVANAAARIGSEGIVDGMAGTPPNKQRGSRAPEGEQTHQEWGAQV